MLGAHTAQTQPEAHCRRTLPVAASHRDARSRSCHLAHTTGSAAVIFWMPLHCLLPLASRTLVANQVVPLMTHVDLVRESLVTHRGMADVVRNGLALLANLASNVASQVPLMAHVDHCGSM
jgi:hypothetical protein